MKINVNGVSLPTHMLNQETSQDSKELLGIITAHDCIPLEGSIETIDDSAYNCAIDYYDVTDGLGYTLSYCWEKTGHRLGRIIVHETRRNEIYDEYFDVTRETVTHLLNKMYGDARYDNKTIERIADTFAIWLGE